VSIATEIIAMQTALGQRANQDSQWLIIKNVERIVKLVQHGLVMITAVSVLMGSFGKIKLRVV
jgi:hypothetical protein